MLVTKFTSILSIFQSHLFFPWTSLHLLSLFPFVPLYLPLLSSTASMYMRKSRAGHSSNAHSSISMSSSTKGVQSRTRLVDCNQGWRGPVISDSELAKLGSEAELLRVRHPCTPEHAAPLTLLCHAMPCNAMPFNTMQCNAMPYHTIQSIVVAYHALPYNALQYHVLLSILKSPSPQHTLLHYSAGRTTRCFNL